LLDAGLVSEQRHGRERRYRLVPEELATIYGWLAHYERFWKGRLQNLAEQLSAPDVEQASTPEPACRSEHPMRTDTSTTDAKEPDS
jgi:hypothetical protein